MALAIIYGVSKFHFTVEFRTIHVFISAFFQVVGLCEVLCDEAVVVVPFKFVYLDERLRKATLTVINVLLNSKLFDKFYGRPEKLI